MSYLERIKRNNKGKVTGREYTDTIVKALQERSLTVLINRALSSKFRKATFIYSEVNIGGEKVIVKIEAEKLPRSDKAVYLGDSIDSYDMDTIEETADKFNNKMRNLERDPTLRYKHN